MSRLPSGGRIDRSRPLRFTFNGRPYLGYAGDTLASALLANDVRVVARSVTYGRPRGVYTAGIEEPNALVQVGPESMVRATQVELVEGLDAVGLNGKGRVTADADAGRFDKVYAHCEVLVIGGGRAGLTAALAAARTGDRVRLVDEQAELGGRLLSAGWDDWLATAIAELRSMPDVRVLTRATAFGVYDQNLVLIAERRDAGGRLWQVRAKRVVLATGAHERPLIFANNDRPGVMLAGAARTYVNRYGVAPGKRAVIFTNNDSTQPLAADLKRAGIIVEAIVDLRAGEAVIDTVSPPSPSGGGQGGGSLEGVMIGPLTGDGPSREVECDLLCVSGGFNPALHLFSQAQGRLRYDEGLACFVADGALPNIELVGAAAGDLGGCGQGAVMPYWVVPSDGREWSSHFVDLERDVTVADVQRALGTGMRSVEHVKRFTTIGTGSDQGKTAGINESAIVAAQLGQPVGAVGVTTFRPPYVPVSFGLIAGRNGGDLFDPIRVTPLHAWHVGHGAVLENVGQWKRPWYYPRDDEDLAAAVRRECQAARENVGVVDVSTLGKIDIQGPDALEFLNRMYTNSFDALKVGFCRYALMCKADGMVFDDGVVMHLGHDHWLATTTTGGAATVLDWMEEWLQTEWPDLKVRLTSVTDQWAAVAVVGPRSRNVIRSLFPHVPLGPESFPFMAIREGETGRIPVRLHRITFSGELAYELWTPSWYGLALWEAVMAAGESLGITPYGTETLHLLRAEKGYIICGQDTDGTVTPQDLGMSWIVSINKPFIGQRSLRRSDTARPDRKHLVGLLPVDGEALLQEGAQLVLEPNGAAGVKMVGHVTSSYRSAALGRTFALALLQRGRERLGGTVYAALNGHLVAAMVTEPNFYDKESRRRDS
ncbi:MAG TPA: 2Fe-2S iron-sulfur cluster-binding protein [Candidatus Dormibacteraeota bacterium]|nr:2Fe-2S iron-sulfur cluster-binding protein [Candidatus Dormibacteraeota bacterium]